MVGGKRRRYTGKFKFQVVLEVFRGNKVMGQIARAYGVHPITITNWKKEFLQKGPEIFGRQGAITDNEKRIGDLERLIGQKEIEIALLKNFLAGSTPGRERSS